MYLREISGSPIPFRKLSDNELEVWMDHHALSQDLHGYCYGSIPAFGEDFRLYGAEHSECWAFVGTCDGPPPWPCTRKRRFPEQVVEHRAFGPWATSHEMLAALAMQVAVEHHLACG